MSSSWNNFLKANYLFFLIILAFTGFNFSKEWVNLKAAIKILKNHQVKPIGSQFTGLVPYFRYVSWAGYGTCLKSTHPPTDIAIQEPYQQAQFILSPTILDYLRPFDYQYVIYQCPAGQKPYQKEIRDYIVLKNFGDVSLLYRKKGM